MKMAINTRLLPIKAHYFFFMAAMGPILPQLNVLGRELGIGPDVMGLVMSILPILYVVTKPIVGFLIDYFTHIRKVIFMSIILLTAVSYAGFYFIPSSAVSLPGGQQGNTSTLLSPSSSTEVPFNTTTQVTPGAEAAVYSTTTFWLFVVLMSLGTINFNVGNCVSDAICFDVLGENQEMKYGNQRVWGTIGFGLTALIGGIAVDLSATNSIGPALIVMLVFTFFDLVSVTKLKLPKMSSDVSIVKEMRKLLKQREIATFLVFATIAGIIDSFIIYYMFWHLEDVAAVGPHASSIKLIEGCVVAAECLGGEILFFSISGRIIKKIGYIHCLSLCFFNYAVRLYLISVITNPWYLIPIELVMQGASYSLAYTCIVVYASQIAPPGTSATVQGLVAGMDDGLGFAIGSLIGGQLFNSIGGQMSFRVFATVALVTCFAHILLRPHKMPTADPTAAGGVTTHYGTTTTAREEIQYEFPVDQKIVRAA